MQEQVGEGDAARDGGEVARMPLSRRRILDAALAVIDAEGFEALTIRRIASELAVAPMALYTHFRNKEELLTGLLDLVAGEVSPPDTAARDWKREVARLARDMRRTFLAHPGLVAVVATHEPLASPNVLRVLEGVLALLRRSRFDDETAAAAFYPVFVYTMGFVSQEVARLPEGEVTPVEQADAERMMRVQFESLPIDRFPLIVELAPHLARCSNDAFFDYGLDCLLLGIEAHMRGGPAMVRP
jgi:AcrR family transcriptional regulator